MAWIPRRATRKQLRSHPDEDVYIGPGRPRSAPSASSHVVSLVIEAVENTNPDGQLGDEEDLGAGGSSIRTIQRSGKKTLKLASRRTMKKQLLMERLRT
jgi:hypothetical protein